MRIAGLFDIHGNLPALAAVVEEVANERVDVVVVGGDTAWGPLTGECIDLLRALPYKLHWVMGNCDREVLAASDGGADASDMTTFTAERLTEQQLAVLRESNPTVTLENGEFARHRTTLEHGAPPAAAAVAALYERMSETESAMERRGPANSLRPEDRQLIETWEGDAREVQRSLRAALAAPAPAGWAAVSARLYGRFARH